MKSFPYVLMPVAFVLMTAMACETDPWGMEEWTDPLPDFSEIPSFDQTMSVDQAYQAIPHRRTEFDFITADMPAAIKDYLDLMFQTIDQATVLRITSLQAYMKHGPPASGTASEQYETVIAFVEGIVPPGRLKPYHEAIIAALHRQRAYYMDWEEHGDSFRNGRHTTLSQHHNVQSASAQLKKAYMILMETFNTEEKKNKDAFFDYHCALDFI